MYGIWPDSTTRRTSLCSTVSASACRAAFVSASSALPVPLVSHDAADGPEALRLPRVSGQPCAKCPCWPHMLHTPSARSLCAASCCCSRSASEFELRAQKLSGSADKSASACWRAVSGLRSPPAPQRTSSVLYEKWLGRRESACQVPSRSPWSSAKLTLSFRPCSSAPSSVAMATAASAALEKDRKQRFCGPRAAALARRRAAPPTKRVGLIVADRMLRTVPYFAKSGRSSLLAAAHCSLPATHIGGRPSSTRLAPMGP